MSHARTNSEDVLPETPNSAHATSASGTTPQRKETSAPARALRIQILLAILVGLAVILLRLLPTDPLLARSVHKLWQGNTAMAAAPDYKAGLGKDPAIDTILPSGIVGNTIRRTAVPSQVGYLLVPVGECAGCMGVDLQMWEREAHKRGLSMILLTSATPKHAALFLREQHLTVPIITDPRSILINRLNALWMARTYLFSPTWRLIWLCRDHEVQYNPFNDPEFEKALKG